LIAELLAAAAVGLSFSNAWLCMGLSFGTRGRSARTGTRFILGRLLGLVIIGLLISLVGAVMDIPPLYFVAIFGAGSVLFGLLMLVGLLGGPGPVKRRIRHALGLQRAGLAGGREGGHCPEGANEARGREGGTENVGNGGATGRLGDRGAFLLGVMRGATPCLKLMVLAPLLIAVGPLPAVALTVVYAVASTAYPLIGFLLAASLSYTRYERPLRVAGAGLLMVIGVYMLVNEYIHFISPGGD